MKLTSKALYVVSALLDITLNQAKGPVALPDISQRQGISLAYLEQLFGKLRKAGIVKSLRGPGGGYLLNVSPEAINIADILQAIGENTANECCGAKQDCIKNSACLAHSLWLELEQHTQTFLQKKNLAMLAQPYQAQAVKIFEPEAVA